MIHCTRALPFLILLVGVSCLGQDIQRFPPPDFESGYEFPVTTTPAPRAGTLNYLDVAVLFMALSLASYLALIKRSRQGIFALTIFSLLYFGFYREGCVCSIGAIQNVTLALFDPSYSVPFTVAVFFFLPLLFALFFGRVFCAGVCPLGAIQDMMLIRPVKIPHWLLPALGLLAYLYLGVAILFAATGSAFIICEYDPFVTFFRLAGNRNIVILGISLLVISLFVGRPYCLFLCPYGVLLHHFTRLTQWQVTVSPNECLQCQLCEEACPFGAIDPPTPKGMPAPNKQDRFRLVFLILLVPIFIAVGGWVASLAADSFSRMHFTVRLAEQIAWEDASEVDKFTEASQVFRDTGQPKEALFQEARHVRDRFVLGAWILGGFLGLVIAGKLIGLSRYRIRSDYEINATDCLACGRCFSYCPQEIKRRRKSKSAPTVRQEAGNG
jgi:ferredoxin